MLLVNSLHYQVKGQLIISNLNFQLSRGQIYILIGPNGSGKTSALNLISGLKAPSSGHISFDGQALSSVKKQIAYLSQNPNLYLELTVDEQLNFWADLHGLTPDFKKDRIHYLLDLLSLKKVQHCLQGHLSTGTRQRVALAQAILPEPSLLLLDEPTNALDPFAQKRFIDLLHTIRPLMAIILSTHHLESLKGLIDGILLFQASSGEVIGPMLPDDFDQHRGRFDQLLYTTHQRECLSL